MTAKMSIRELTRNGNMMGEYDYIDIEDRKSHDYKGVFIPARYAEDVKKYLEEKIAKERQAKVDEVMKFAGILSGKTGNMSIQELKASKAERYITDE